MNPKRNRTRDIGFYLLILVLLACVMYTVLSGDQPDQLSYAEVKDLFINEKVESFVYDGTKNRLTMDVRDSSAKDGTKEVVYDVYSFSLFYQDLGELIEQQHADGIIKDYQIEPVQSSWWLQLIPYVLFIGFMIFWIVMMNKANGMGGAGGAAKFGKARTRLGSEEKNKKTFADVAGADEEKAELQELVEFLKNPRSFTEMGARIPKGVLLVGPPGTGKTTTLVEAIYETLRRENQVLVCAQSNMAVDWISERLMDRGVDVLRVGNPTRVNDKMLSQTYERRYEDQPDYPQLWALRKTMREMRSASRKSEAFHQKMDRLKSRSTELEMTINQ